MTSYFTAVRHFSVTTPIPTSSAASFAPKPYIEALHDPSSLLNLAPRVVSTVPVEVPASLIESYPKSDSTAVEIKPGETCYEVTESIPLSGPFKMTAAFHNVEDGAGCALVASGVRVDSWTRVVKSEGESAKGWELKEDVRLQANWFFLPLYRSNIAKARKDIHEGLIKRIEGYSRQAEGARS